MMEFGTPNYLELGIICSVFGFLIGVIVGLIICPKPMLHHYNGEE